MKKAEDFVMTKGDVDMEAAVVRALERQPSVTVPADFAARVRASLPAQVAVRSRRSVGNAVGVAAAGVLVAAVCWLAPHAAPSFESVAFDVELVLLMELAGVALWLSMRRRGI